jgi:hypothetical protein
MTRDQGQVHDAGSNVADPSVSAQGLARSWSDDREAVILLHGLGRSEMSLIVLEQMLAAAGYRIVNVGYPSQETDLAGLMKFVSDAYAACGDIRVNFVTPFDGRHPPAGMACGGPSGKPRTRGNDGAAEQGLGSRRPSRTSQGLRGSRRAPPVWRSGQGASSRSCRRSTSSSA